MLVTRQGTWQQRVFWQACRWRQYCAIAMCAIALLAVCGSTHAAYEVEIEAPWPLKKLLKDHLDLYRFSKRTDISQDQLGFLVTATLSQTNDLLRTEGYFSAIITTDMHSA